MPKIFEFGFSEIRQWGRDEWLPVWFATLAVTFLLTITIGHTP